MKRPHPLKQAINGFVHRHETKIRFVVTGGFNTALGLALFPMLYLALAPLGMHYIFVLVISNIVCVGFAFLTNKFFVFRTSGNYLKEFGRFLLFHLSHFVLSLLAVPALVEFAGISPIIAQPFFAAAIIISSYFWHRQITFVHKTPDEHECETTKVEPVRQRPRETPVILLPSDGSVCRPHQGN